MARRRMDQVETRLRVVVPGSTSNLGCGFDCLGVAIRRTITVEVRSCSHAGPPRVVEMAGTLAEGDLGSPERITCAMRAFADRVGRRLPGFELRATSNIPVARGLGSSGAATVAGLVLAQRLLGSSLPIDALFEIGTSLEGHPDNIGPALLGGAVVACPSSSRRILWFRQRLHRELRLAIAVPVRQLETARARSVLPATIPFADARDHARHLPQLLRGLEDLDRERLRVGTSDRLHTRYRLRLLPGAREAMDAATEAGALAAALSGSGSAVVAVVRGDGAGVLRAMLRAYARAGEAAGGFVEGVPRRGYRLTDLSATHPT